MHQPCWEPWCGGLGVVCLGAGDGEGENKVFRLRGGGRGEPSGPL